MNQPTDKPSITAEFRKYAQQINDKLKEAAAAMQEANKLAVQSGLRSVSFNPDDHSERSNDERRKIMEMHALINVNVILREIDNSGWSSSSLEC